MRLYFKDFRGMVRVKIIAAVVLLSVFTLFILQNTKVVEIRFIFWEFSLSRVVLLMGALFTGILIGLFIGWEASGRNRSK